MRLSDWLEKHEKSLEWLASEVGRDASVMSKLKDGAIRPSNQVAAAIHRLTKGAVTSVDHEDVFIERQARGAERAAAAQEVA